MKQPSSTRWIKVSVIGLLVALVISSVMTFSDWQKNPSAIFYSPQGTNWEMVWDTFISWFLPLLGVIIPIFIVIHWLVVNIKKSNSSAE